MMIEAAHKIGLSVTVFADSRSCPAFKICDDFIESSFTDMDALSKFREQCDVFTLEYIIAEETVRNARGELYQYNHYKEVGND